MISCREFLQFAGAVAAPLRLAEQKSGRPRGSEFVFARLRYDSGDWDFDWRNKRFLREDNTRFAINIVVYVMG